MKKTLDIEGVSATITVSLNAKTERRTGENRITHDEQTYTIQLHRVTIDLDSEYVYSAARFCETKDLEGTIKELEKSAKSVVYNKKHADDPTREEKLLQGLGFK